MSSEQTFAQSVEKLREEIRALPDNAGQDVIEETARRLEAMNYSPPVIMDNGSFLRLKKDLLLGEIDRILALPDAEACALAPNDSKKCEDLRLQFISVLIFYFKNLIRLRDGDLESWDEIDELYVHD